MTKTKIYLGISKSNIQPENEALDKVIVTQLDVRRVSGLANFMML